ncbi:MAG TPA: ABC transporter permease subunit [Acetobacteraceae bacterium]|nr:ABC transporter permease subunit [Acetobacteraceae bacterium]
MLAWSKSGRASAWLLFGVLAGVVYGLPAMVILLASLAGQWNGILPSHLTFAHYGAAISGPSGAALRTSLVTGVVASLLALVNGTAASLALRHLGGPPRRILNAIFFLPSAMPSVSVGLGLLVAFSRPPILLNGTIGIVFAAHFILISAFTFGSISAGLARIPADCEQVAESLGAAPSYLLRRVTLPLVLPYLTAAFSLSFALSMGELGATVMVYPPGWVTLPVQIFGLSDRGDVFPAAALTVLLAASTLAALAALSLVPARSTAR